MRAADWVNLAGLITGPVVAVLITLVWTRFWQAKDRKVWVLRQLAATRGLPHDPAYHIAMNAVPIEFAENPAVMETWRNYIDAANKGVVGNNEMSALISAVMRSLGYNETKIGTVLRGAYASDGFMDAQKRQAEALVGMAKTGEATTRSAAAAEEMLKRLPPAAPPAA
jgi:hypothetical protein